MRLSLFDDEVMYADAHNENAWRLTVPIAAPFSVQLQLEASFSAIHRDQAQQRRELLLVLRGNASHGQESGPLGLHPRSFALEMPRVTTTTMTSSNVKPTCLADNLN